jgi:hypothetical protein
MKGLGLLTERPPIITKCPKHFGIKTRTPFSPWQNNFREIETDVEGTRWAIDQVRWFIEKGDAIVPHKSLVQKYDCHFTMRESDLPSAKKNKSNTTTEAYREIVFLTSEAEEAPVRFADIVKREQPPLPIFFDA